MTIKKVYLKLQLFANDYFIHNYIVLSIPIQYKQFAHRAIWHLDKILTFITILGQSGPGNNGNVWMTP